MVITSKEGIGTGQTPSKETKGVNGYYPGENTSPTVDTTPSPTPDILDVGSENTDVEDKLKAEEQCIADGKYWYDNICNDAEKVDGIETDNDEMTPPKTRDSWSLVSLIATLISAITMLAQLIAKSVMIDEKGIELVRNKIYKIITVIIAIIGFIYFFMTNNIKLPMELINESTPISVVITLIVAVVHGIGLRWNEDK